MRSKHGVSSAACRDQTLDGYVWQCNWAKIRCTSHSQCHDYTRSLVDVSTNGRLSYLIWDERRLVGFSTVSPYDADEIAHGGKKDFRLIYHCRGTRQLAKSSAWPMKLVCPSIFSHAHANCSISMQRFNLHFNHFLESLNQRSSCIRASLPSTTGAYIVPLVYITEQVLQKCLGDFFHLQW